MRHSLQEGNLDCLIVVLLQRVTFITPVFILNLFYSLPFLKGYRLRIIGHLIPRVGLPALSICHSIQIRITSVIWSIGAAIDQWSVKFQSQQFWFNNCWGYSFKSKSALDLIDQKSRVNLLVPVKVIRELSILNFQ